MLGHSLKIEHTALKRIENQYGSDSERCKLEMVAYWLKSDVTASWEKLLQALRDRNYSDVIRSLQGRIVISGEDRFHPPPHPVAGGNQSGMPCTESCLKFSRILIIMSPFIDFRPHHHPPVHHSCSAATSYFHSLCDVCLGWS